MTLLKSTVATLEQKCSYLAPVPPEVPLIARARITKMGKSVVFLESSLELGNGKILSRASQTNSLLTMRKSKAAL